MTEIASRYGLALYSIAEDRKQINELQIEAKELRKILFREFCWVEAMILEMVWLILQDYI